MRKLSQINGNANSPWPRRELRLQRPSPVREMGDSLTKKCWSRISWAIPFSICGISSEDDGDRYHVPPSRLGWVASPELHSSRRLYNWLLLCCLYFVVDDLHPAGGVRIRQHFGEKDHEVHFGRVVGGVMIDDPGQRIGLRQLRMGWQSNR